ncbi:MAG: hypothetical protein M0P12_01340 [Paludibacteraceae bacterium]|nr:hypothetical protein [Paludibacteraceae bacterium]
MSVKKLTRDWGCGSCISGDEILKDRFLREAKGYLKDVASRLIILGWEANLKSSVYTNRGGIAVSGEATLVMKKDGSNLFVQISSSCIGMVSGKQHPNNVYILHRKSTAEKDIYACRGDNRYADTRLDSKVFAELIGE